MVLTQSVLKHWLSDGRTEHFCDSGSATTTTFWATLDRPVPSLSYSPYLKNNRAGLDDLLKVLPSLTIFCERFTQPARDGDLLEFRGQGRGEAERVRDGLARRNEWLYEEKGEPQGGHCGRGRCPRPCPQGQGRMWQMMEPWGCQEWLARGERWVPP